MNKKTYCDPNPYEYNEDGLKLRDSLYKTFEKVYREQRELGYSPAEVKCLVIDTLVSAAYLVDALMACDEVKLKNKNMFKLVSSKKDKNSECRFIPPPPPPQKHNEESEISDVKTYQDLTFKALDKLIRKECEKGNSKLCLKCADFRLSENMVEYLENKGFCAYIGSNFNIISW